MTDQADLARDVEAALTPIELQDCQTALPLYNRQMALQSCLKAADDGTPGLVAALVAAEEKLDAVAQHPCQFCRAADYDAQVGVVHRPGCILLSCRAALRRVKEALDG